MHPRTPALRALLTAVEAWISTATGARTLRLALALLLAGCTEADVRATPDTVPEDQRHGGTAVFAIPMDFHSLDPLVSERGSEAEIMAYLLFAPLVRYDSALAARPYLAERWDTVRVAGDSLDLSFHLRSDVKWHDGVPTTARDVKFAFDRMMDPRSAYPNVSLLRGYSRRAAVVDDSTVRFRLRPFPEYLEIWSRIGAMPEHLLRGVAPQEESRAAYGQHPVGNGPFRFAARVPGQSFTLEANPGFPRALGGRPYLDRLIHRIIPEGSTRFSELAGGGVDVMVGIGGPIAEQIRRRPELRLIRFQTPTRVYIAWNTRIPLLSDERVRRALTMAIDRRAIVQGVVHGFAVEGRTPVTPAHWAFEARDPTTTLPYDPATAARLLDEAGWRARDGAAVRTDASGRPLHFTLKCPSGSEWCDVVQVVQAQLRRVGAEMDIQPEEMNTLIADMNRGDAAHRDYEAAVMNATDYVGKSDEAEFGSAAQSGPYAETGYHSPALDSLFAALDRTTDREAARPLWLRYQREMARAEPVTVLYYSVQRAALGPRIQGVHMDARGYYVSAPRWWIIPARKP
jgi:peptide/nickel transport system substrate-binding protein